MTRAMTKEEFLAAAPDVLSAVVEDTFVIRQGEKFVAAIVSEREYDMIRRARGERAIAALNRLGSAIESSGASESELRELEKALDRKA
ncbi:MAG: hypothetical protein M3R43_10185 [Acidobacteriota bacterium]|nr:hypothetical protein [Acidobacteriota bacterium]